MNTLFPFFSITLVTFSEPCWTVWRRNNFFPLHRSCPSWTQGGWLAAACVCGGGGHTFVPYLLPLCLFFWLLRSCIVLDSTTSRPIPTLWPRFVWDHCRPSICFPQYFSFTFTPNSICSSGWPHWDTPMVQMSAMLLVTTPTMTQMYRWGGNSCSLVWVYLRNESFDEITFDNSGTYCQLFLHQSWGKLHWL